MTALLQFGEGLLVFLMAAALVGIYLVYELLKHRHQLRRAERDKERAAVEFDRIKARALHAAMNNQANYKVGSDRSLEVIHRFPYPAHHTKVLEAPAQPLQLPQPTYPQVALSTIVEELPRNALSFVYGTDERTGEKVKTTLPKAVHIQIIGDTGQGKSQEATSILTQLAASNDSEHLQMALFDHEGETTVPFQTLPHVRYHADDPVRVARGLHDMVKLLEHRDKVHVLFPHILIFIEEFLSLRRTMPSSVQDQALEDFTTLALRGRKRGISLFCVGQTAYVDKAIRDAQMQFQSNIAFSIRPRAAQSAGFVDFQAVKKLYEEKREMQFWIERAGGNRTLLAPDVDRELVPLLLGNPLAQPACDPLATEEFSNQVTGSLQPGHNQVRNQLDPALQAKAEHVRRCIGNGMVNAGEIIKEVWKMSPRGGAEYERVKQEYATVMKYLIG